MFFLILCVQIKTARGDIMKKIQYLTILGSTVLFIITGCAPPASATKNKITIKVSQPISTEWAYVISTAAASNISKVVFTLTVQGCSVESMPQGWKSGQVNGGLQLENAAGATTVPITLACDAMDGPNYIDVHSLGAAATTIGPISGPT
jgi:hypothetical protein